MKTYNVILTSQTTGRITEEYQDATMDDILRIIEKHGNDQMPVDMDSLMRGDSCELNSDSYIRVEKA